MRLSSAGEDAREKRYAVSKYCGVHSCRVLGCERRGMRELVGICGKHFGDCYDYC